MHKKQSTKCLYGREEKKKRKKVENVYSSVQSFNSSICIKRKLSETESVWSSGIQLELISR
jgi:hypothetical protein